MASFGPGRGQPCCSRGCLSVPPEETAHPLSGGGMAGMGIDRRKRAGLEWEQSYEGVLRRTWRSVTSSEADWRGGVLQPNVAESLRTSLTSFSYRCSPESQSQLPLEWRPPAKKDS